jgi:hypothetical protein
LNCVAAMSTTGGAGCFAGAELDGNVPDAGDVVGDCANAALASVQITKIIAGIRIISPAPEKRGCNVNLDGLIRPEAPADARRRPPPGSPAVRVLGRHTLLVWSFA